MQWKEILGKHDRYMDEVRTTAFEEMKRLGEREQEMLGMLERAGFKTGDILDRLSYALDEVAHEQGDEKKDE